MITAILLILALLIGLPILVKLIEKFSARWMVKISELEGFWEFMSGKGITPPAKREVIPGSDFDHIVHPWGREIVPKCPVTKGGHALISDGKKMINSWECPVTKSVKLTEDWELPTLERELAEEKRWGDGLLEGELEKN